MGFKLGDNAARLTFDESVLGGAFVGLWVRVGIDMALEDWYGWRDRYYGRRTKDEEVALFTEFGDTFLLEWNFEDKDDQPVPATGLGLIQNAPPRLICLIIEHWFSAAVSTSDPLEPPSKDGSLSQAE